MSDHPFSMPCTAFDDIRMMSDGPLIEVALAVKTLTDSGAHGTILVFDDRTGRVVDLDLRGTKVDVIERLARLAPAATPTAAERPEPMAADDEPKEARGRGRPKLGVVGREVTLLPRHWDWLAAQRGGASVALRALVDEARRSGGDKHRRRMAHEIAYRAMSTLAGNLPGFEEASRALFADDRARFDVHAAPWAADIRAYVTKLAFDPAGEPTDG